MPYADVTQRRTYHTHYMQQWRARQHAPQPEASALGQAAQQLHLAAQALHRQAADANSFPTMLATLRQMTLVLTEVTALLVAGTAGSSRGREG